MCTADRRGACGVPDPNGSLVERPRRDGGRGGERDCCRSRILAANGRAGCRTADRADPGRPDRDLRRDRGPNVRGDAGNRRRARADPRLGHAGRQSRTGCRHDSRRATASRRPAADGARGRPRAEAKVVTQGRRGRPPPHRAHRSRSRNRDRDVVLLRLQDVVRCSAGARDSAGVATRLGTLAVASFHVGRAVAGGSLAALLTVRRLGLCPIRSCEGALSRCDRRPSDRRHP